MIVTDKKYSIEDQQLKKLDLMVKRLKGTDDIVLPIDGDEGQGKTELAIGTCYYIAYKTGRKYDIDNIFFDLDEVIRFAASKKKQIIHYDEAALGLLRTQWQKKSQQKFLQLVMIARKKQHFIILCIPKFHRLPPYVLEDRAIGMMHVYAHKNIHKGRYCYYTKSALANLYQDYNKKKVKTYQKHFSFRGRFVEASKKVFTKEQHEVYDKKKDDAILSVGVDDNLRDRQKKWLEQRDKLIRGFRKDLKLSSPQMEKLLEKYGVPLKQNAIRKICPTQQKKILLPTLTASPL